MHWETYLQVKLYKSAVEIDIEFALNCQTFEM